MASVSARYWLERLSLFHLLLLPLNDSTILTCHVSMMFRYGGVLLGPVRFTHIEDCAREVCQFFKSYEEVEELIARLTALDDELADLRASLAKRSARSEDGGGSSAPTAAGGSASPTTAGDRSATGLPPDTAGSSQTAVHSSPNKTPASYDRLLKAKPPDVGTAQRLVKAREKAVSSVKALLSRGGAAARGTTSDGREGREA